MFGYAKQLEARGKLSAKFSITSIYSLLLGLVGVIALIMAWSSIPWSNWPTLLILLILATIARRLEFNMGRLAGVSFDTAVHFAAVVIVGPGGAALVAGLAAILGLLSTPKIRRNPTVWMRLLVLLRNGGMFALMQLGSGAVYALLTAGSAPLKYSLWSWPLWGLAIVWLGVYHLINVLAGYPMYLLTRQITLRDLLAQDPSIFLTELTTLPAGALLVVIYQAEGLGGLFLVGTGLMLISALVRRLATTSQRLGAQLKAAATLTQVGQALSASLDMDKVISLIAQHVSQVLRTRTLTVALYDQEQQLLHYPIIIENGQSYPAQSLPFKPEDNVTSFIIAKRQPLRLNTPEEINRLPVQSIVTGTGQQMQSYLGVPMIARDHVLGVISVQSPMSHAFTDDDLQTLTTLAQQAAISIDNARLVRDLAARERMKQELEIARRTQLSLLPSSVPMVPGLDIAGISIPAHEVGGDFYSYYTLEGKVGIAIGDVSGKGMPAALLMALSAGILEAEAPRAVTPGQVLANTDRALRPHAARSRLNVGCCYIAVSYPAITLQIASAGMPAPLIRYKEGQVKWLDTRGLPLGVPDAPMGYIEVTQSLSPGDALILTSDGMLEAKNAYGEMFGFERLEAAAASISTQSAQAMIDSLLAQMYTFIKPQEPHDDVTLVVVRAT